MSDTRDKLPPPPIEPLPDLAWARLERVVLAELDVPETRSVRMPLTRWPLFALAGAALAGAAVLAIVVATRDHGTAAPAPAVATGDGIAGPSRVATGDAPTEVTFGDAHITVAPASALVLDGAADHGVLAVLERGSASFAVAPRRGRPPFMIQAGAAQVRVVGTELEVTRIAPDDAAVAVTEGTVEVTFHGRVTRVTAGEKWTSVPPVTTTTATTATTSVEPPQPAHHDKKPDATHTHAAPAGPTDQQRYDAAAALELTDPEAATAAYRDLARGKSAWAANALYAMGRLAHERGDTGRAKLALTSYIHRFPRGANVADARALLLKLEGASR